MVDTSHLCFLARIAVQLESTARDRQEILSDLVLACRCEDRKVMTGRRAFDCEINLRGDNPRVLHELGVADIRSDCDWCGEIEVPLTATDDPLRTTIESMNGLSAADDDLIAFAVDESGNGVVLVVTNDEGLHAKTSRVARELALPGGPGTLRTINSADFVDAMVSCGAYAEEVRRAALVAEQANIDNLDLAPAKRRLKEERLLGIARANSISEFPPVPEDVNDADIRERFLEWANETEQ